jgi:hypothetical protein
MDDIAGASTAERTIDYRASVRRVGLGNECIRSLANDTEAPHIALAKGEFAMAKHSDHGIVLDDKSQEQPKDKERPQTVTKTKPGHMPPQPITKEDNKRPPKSR